MWRHPYFWNESHKRRMPQVLQILNLEVLLIGMNVTIKLDENTDNDIMTVPNFSEDMLSEM